MRGMSHLTEVCMSYRTHLRFSAWIGMQLLFGAAKAFLHAVFPPVFAKSTSVLVRLLDDEIRRAGCDGQSDAAQTVPLISNPF